MNTNRPKKVVTRFAPSPTGFLHIGGVRTALFAYLFARGQGGEFILRIEDTDKNREVSGSIEHIMESLRWLNITWDYGPDKPGPFGSCLQSDRLTIYKQYAERLIAKGLAYPDPYTDEEIQIFKEQAQAEKRPFLYRLHRPETIGEWDGTKPLRLKVADIKRYTWHDAVRGELSAGEEMLDDVVLIKSDGYPTYNFAHIVDDAEMGVTHIMRADEFIASTPKFLSIYDALELPYPVFVTLPPIMREDGTKKLGKRDGAKDILDYRDEGIRPEAMLNFLTLIGWNPGTDQEVFSVSELMQQFSIEKIQRSGGAFNETKLRWMNKQYLDTLSREEFLSYLNYHELVDTLPGERVVRALPTIRERISVRSDFINNENRLKPEFSYLLDDSAYETSLLLWKNDQDYSNTKNRLMHVNDLLKAADFSSPETIKEALWFYAESEGKGEVLWPLRVALSRQEKSPDPFTLCHILGCEESIRRLATACGKIDSDAT